MLKINELNSYLKSKGVPEDSYSINEVNDESLCIVEENKKWCHKTKSHFIEVGFLFSIKVISYDPFSKFFLVVG